MDPLQYHEILNYSQQGSKLQVSVNSSGNVVMVPVVHLGDEDDEDSLSPSESLSQHVTTHIITSEQVRGGKGGRVVLDLSDLDVRRSGVVLLARPYLYRVWLARLGQEREGS